MSKLRAVIYARHSTDKQARSSSADQATACLKLVKTYDAELIGTYADPEISGYRRDRPELMKLLRHIEAGEVDLVLCEALDRIARDGEDINWLGKKLSYHRVRLVTQTEGEIDEIKLAVAGLLGSMFLANLRQKTFRGMEAAVLAKRLAGGRAYGYRKVARVDDRGCVVNGIFEIYPPEARIVDRIYREFAACRSSIQIATDLNAEGIPSPRGGQWNASTIRGDPKKLVGILNNPLYRGRIVWGRREWRKNPDSDRRERRYRIRDQSEWITVDMPDLRIIDEAVTLAVEAELQRRHRPELAKSLAASNRRRHLLSGLIRCGTCGSNFTIVGRDYYRCSGNRERGTCSNKTSVRLGVAEDAVLEAVHKDLLTPKLARVFAEEFNLEVSRLTRTQGDDKASARARLKILETEIGNLAENLLHGVVSSTLSGMLADREAERRRLQDQIAQQCHAPAKVLAHPVLLKRFEEMVGALREALNQPQLRSEAAELLRGLIDSVTVTVDDHGQPALDIEAQGGALIDFATKTEAPHRSLGGGRSVAVVAGVGFEPTTFRL